MNTQLDKLPIKGSRRFANADAVRIGKSDPEKLIRVSIYARRNPCPDMDAITKLKDIPSALPGQRNYLTDDEFISVYGANPKELDAIETWAGQNNLRVLDRTVAQKRVTVEGLIKDINTALGIELEEYEHAALGRYRGRDGQIFVPENLHGIIEGIFGLDTRPIGTPRFKRGRFSGVASLQPLSTPWPGTFFPSQVASLYNFPAATDGSGQNIAIFAFNGADPDRRGGYQLPALQNYFEDTLGQTTPEITDVVIHGAGNNPGPDTDASSKNGDSTGEVMLDMCIVGSVAPGARIFMYFTEFTSQGWVDALHDAIAGKNDISVISISYGNPENDPNSLWTNMGVNLVNQAFEASIAKGITICCASGDDGSMDGGQRGSEVDFPASSPNVLGVGGTNLVASGNMQSIAGESVWNEILRREGASGGGISDLFNKPSYQYAVNVPPSANPSHRIGRGVPDVSAVGDPETGVVIMRIDGRTLEPMGGTSASAPLWAALILRLNQALNARCGFLNTLLYSRFSQNVLRDITIGNNGAYNATIGWDPCTGLGSPDGEKLLQALQ